MQSEAKRDESDDSEEDDGRDDRNEENKDANEGQKVSLDMIKGWRAGLEVLLFKIWSFALLQLFMECTVLSALLN